MYSSPALFTTLLTILAQLGYIEAHPTEPPRVSIPLTHAVHTRSLPLVPPAIVHQQHANRGITRLDLMHGRGQTSDYELLSKIRKRASSLPPNLLKRYYNGLSDVLAHPAHVNTDHNPSTNKQSLAVTEESSTSSSSAVGGVTPAHKPTFHNTIGLDIQARDVGYIGTIQLGTPPRNFQLIMDSGSADLWVGSEDCNDPYDDGCGDHTFLGPKSSSSFVDTGKNWTIRYGTGAVSGHIVRDHIRFAGLQLKSYEFGVAIKETTDFTSDDIPFDGLAGLAKSMLSQQGTITLVESLQKAGHIKHAIVSYKIPRLADGKNDGELTLGAMNPAKFNPKTTTTMPNVNLLGFWEAAVDGVKVNGKNMGWKNRMAIFDTGTTLIIAPQQDVDMIHKAIPGAHFDGNSWTVPCTTKSSISLTFGGREFSIDPRDIPFMPVDPDFPKGNCTSGFSAGSVGADNEWLVGDVFLKNVYLSTNVEKDQITLAKLAN